MIEIDANKRAVYLFYLARAAHRYNERERLHEQAEVGIKKLRKLDTKHIHEHMDELSEHLDHIAVQEKYIVEQQKEEELIHKDLKSKINVLEDKLGKYLKTQEGRKKRIKELEEKINKKFETKKEKAEQLKKDIRRLTLIYQKAHQSRKYSKEALKQIHERIQELRKKVHLIY